MKTPPSFPPSADETTLDRLLARRYRDTTPAFEARWTQVKRDLRHSRAQPRRHWRWVGFGWLVPVAAAALVLVFVRAPSPFDPATAPPHLAELWRFNELLGPVLPLLDEENRAAVLHLPADPSHL